MLILLFGINISANIYILTSILQELFLIALICLVALGLLIHFFVENQLKKLKLEILDKENITGLKMSELK